MTEDKINIRVEFEGENKKRLEALEHYYGLAQGTDLVRLLINEKYRELFPKEA